MIDAFNTLIGFLVVKRHLLAPDIWRNLADLDDWAVCVLCCFLTPSTAV